MKVFISGDRLYSKEISGILLLFEKPLVLFQYRLIIKDKQRNNIT